MSQTIKLVKWLEATLWLLGVWDIFETTISEVVNDEGGELWTCSLASNIVRTGRWSSTKIGAQIDAVLLSLQAIERIWLLYA